jgi:hypothetical protein
MDNIEGESSIDRDESRPSHHNIAAFLLLVLAVIFS